MFNAIMQQGTWPNPFKESNTVVIPKPKRADYSIPKSFRPIALLNCLAKLFTKCLTRRLQDEGRRHQIFHPLQFGGMQHHSTLDAAMSMLHEISEARCRGLTVTCVAFDVAQFFPSIDHEALLTILAFQGFAKEVVQIFKSYLHNRTTSYFFGQLTGGMFDLPFGIPQGDGPSPTLASLFIAPALHISVPFNPESSVKLIFYVDDGNIITMSTSPQKNVKVIQTTYKSTYGAFTDLGLTLEHSKTDLFHAPAYDPDNKRRINPAPLPSIDLGFAPFTGNTPLQPTNKWRYLGYFFDGLLSFDYHVNFYFNKAFSTTRAFRMFGKANGGLDPKNRRLFYISCVFPILTYGFQLWYRINGKGHKAHLKKLSKVHHYVARWITGTFSTTPIRGILHAAGLAPLRVTLNLQLKKTGLRLARLGPSHAVNQIADRNMPSHLR